LKLGNCNDALRDSRGRLFQEFHRHPREPRARSLRFISLGHRQPETLDPDISMPLLRYQRRGFVRGISTAESPGQETLDSIVSLNAGRRRYL
ncbi:MAG TPA: hypothetical protein VFS84_15500, partial [Candidatus Binatia bacterium]|nr:hypothetical protein [Candidatus Binatia bacterium]